MKNKFHALMVLLGATGMLLTACGTPSEPSKPTVGPDPTEQPSETPTVAPTENPTEDPTEEVTPLPNEYDLMHYWAGHMEETAYEVVEGENEMVINYTDVTGENAGGWQYVARTFSYDALDLARFGEYKKLSFTGKLEKTTGSDIVMVKLEGGTNLEKKFNFGPELRTYELSLATIGDWSTMNNLLLFANRGISEPGNGKMTFTRFCLSKEEVNPDYDIGGNMPSVPQDINMYDGGDKFTVMKGWGYDDKNAIKTEYKDGKYHFTYGEGSKEVEDWAYVNARIKSGTTDLKESGFNRAHFTISGTKGTNALVKFENIVTHAAKEYMIADLTGEVEEYDLDITSILKDADPDTEFKTLVFPAAGRKGAELAGEVVLHDCFLDKEIAKDPMEKYFNDAEGEEIAVKTLFNQESVYTIKSEGLKHTIDYKLANVPDYRAIKVYTRGENLKTLNRIVADITSTSNVQIIVKPYNGNGANEHKIDLVAGVKQSIEIDFPETIINPKEQTVIMIGTSDTSVLEGTVTIENMKFVKAVAEVKDPDANYSENGEIAITKWLAQPWAKIETKGNVTTMAIDKVGGWEPLSFKVAGKDVKTYNHITGTVTTDTLTEAIFKPFDNGAFEFKMEPMEANKEYKIDIALTDAADYTKNCLLFIGFSNAYKGTLTFKDLKFTVAEEKDPTANYSEGGVLNITKWLEKPWLKQSHENGVTTLTITEKPQGWDALQFKVAGDDVAEYDKIVGTVKSSVDTYSIFKPFDNSALEMHMEPMEANKEYKIDIDLRKGFDPTKLGLMFLSWDAVYTGIITFTNLHLEKLDPNTNYSDGTTINVTKFLPTPWLTQSYENGVLTLTLDKPSGWDALKFKVAGSDLSEYKKITGTVKASAATYSIFKPFDNGALEMHMEPMEENKEYTIDIDLTKGFDGTKDCLMFLAWDHGFKGTITFTNLQFVK